MLSLSKSQKSSSADHEYLDIALVNNSTDAFPKPVIFDQTKPSNIVNRCSDYYVSVIRWSFFSTIPIIVPDVTVSPPNTPYTGATDYFINIGYGTDPLSAIFNPSSNANVVFEPENLLLSNPAFMPTSKEVLNDNLFYHIKNVDSFLAMVNKALNSAYLWCKATYPTPLQNSIAPRFIWNSSKNKIDFVASKEFVEGITANTFYIGMNPTLQSLFDTFPFTCISVSPSVQSKNYIMRTTNCSLTGASYLISGTPYYIYSSTQQSSSVVSWCPVSSLSFTSTMMPISQSQTGTPQFLGPPLTSNSAEEGLSSSLTDFVIPLETGCEYSNQMLYYIPTSEYRLFDLTSSDVLRKLSLVVNWIDRQGFSHICNMKQGTMAQLKLMFRKKTFIS